jgi:hypothetical protein
MYEKRLQPLSKDKNAEYLANASLLHKIVRSISVKSTTLPRECRLKKLVWVEHHNDIRSAIQRERNLKHWLRRWKGDLIEAANPEWHDLYDQLS